MNQCAVWRDLRASDDADADEGGGRGACMDLIEIERAARMPINVKRTYKWVWLRVPEAVSDWSG